MKQEMAAQQQKCAKKAPEKSLITPCQWTSVGVFYEET